MSDKALISDLTWRSLDMQRKAFPDMPHFVAPDDLESLFRPTRRNTGANIHVMSLAVVADNEKDFRSFLGLLAKRGCGLVSLEEDIGIYDGKYPSKFIVALWREARTKGAAKIGARVSADRKKASTAECIAKIKDKWPLPSKEVSTKTLLAEAGLSLNTVKSHLGSRIIAQHNYKAKVKRRETLKAKSNAKYPRMKRATHYIDEKKFRRMKDDE
ncbi:unnamed protein product [Sphagnum jensenii]|uniref:Uncharacterized protein n=1 Tax=Sphagnum jensenii TaxID=128206 RepID=A0ABP0V8D4_9BRYO